jgi:hypothetical protein
LNLSGVTLGVLGQLVLRVEPGCAIGSPDVASGAIGKRGIEASEPKQNVRIADPLGEDMRPASGAEAPELARG